ncbi:MAG: hypothetical protein JWO32_2374 [Bacteroidetes bacterium]|jgi:CheY-like chemotaxis protein|nr:hypothetical protein [Bacteroidota bacterium]
MEKSNEHLLNIVIADDDEVDQFMMKKAIWEINSNHKITSVYNGLQLIEYLQRKGTYKNCGEPKPDCILLDLNMPLLTGFDVLKKIRKSPEFDKTPVYIFSTTATPTVTEKLISTGANGCYIKSHKQLHLKKAMQDVLKQVSPHSPETVSFSTKK